MIQYNKLKRRYKLWLNISNEKVALVTKQMQIFAHDSENSIISFYDVFGQKILCILAASISLVSFYHFYQTQQILSDYDAIARLNIARKIVDSITPGIGQLGGIWLPFPQILMLPFIKIDFFWHTGLAGSIISMSAFIISTVYLYKTAYLITKQRVTAILVWFVFVSNINVLLLQTMAMSESFFLFSMIMTFYFLTVWSMKRDLLSLLYTSFFVILITLTRYEGYFIFAGAFLTVITQCVISYVKDKNYRKAEGVILLFGVLASYGILLWCLYCALFYKDPLYWLHLYAGPKGQINTTVLPNAGGTKPHPKEILTSFLTYSETMLWMNGIIHTLAAVAGFGLLLVTTIKTIKSNKQLNTVLPITICGVVLYIFLIYGYQKNLIPDIEFPSITLLHVMSKSFNYVSHSNIRYGTVMAPLIALYLGFLASKNRILTVTVLFLIFFQIYTTYYTQFFFFFQLPKAWSYSVPTSASWFKQHYDHGYILTSANRHENLMFQTGLPYSDFIYEGSRSYWLTSLNNPAKYATWVIFDEYQEGDSITTYLTSHARSELATLYTLDYQKNGFKIYHLKPRHVALSTSIKPVKRNEVQKTIESYRPKKS